MWICQRQGQGEAFVVFILFDFIQSPKTAINNLPDYEKIVKVLVSSILFNHGNVFFENMKKIEPRFSLKNEPNPMTLHLKGPRACVSVWVFF